MHCIFFLIALFVHLELCLTQDVRSNFTQTKITTASSDESVPLNCTLNQNVMWTYQRAGSNEAETISTNSSVLRIVSSQNVGLYTCSNGDPAMSEVFQAINFTRPFIPHTGQSITYTEGAVNQTISCTSYSYPPPSFQWSVTYDNGVTVEVMPNQTDTYSISDDQQGTSTIIFFTVATTDRGTYICNATNDASNGSESILLRVRGRLAPLYPFIGIVCEVIVIAAIVFFIRRQTTARKRKFGSEFGSRFQELDSSVNSQDERNISVRYRNIARS